MRTIFIWFSLMFLFSVLFSQFSNRAAVPVVNIKFREFIAAVEADRVKEVTFKVDGDIEGLFVNPKDVSLAGLNFKTVGDTTNPEVFKILMAHHVTPNYDYTPKSNGFAQLFINLIPLFILIGFLVYSMKKMNGASGKFDQFSKNNAQLARFTGKISFDDVAGNDEAKEDLKEIIDYLKDPSKYVKMGIRIPKGVLMEGPPGCGKTLLAKATAGEAGVPFYFTSGSDFVEMFVGVGASRTRDLFAQARKNSPCIIFIDEIDAIGRKRSSSPYGGHSEMEQTLNQILVEMDGFGTSEGVIIMGATNRADVLDDALVRPGRFDRRITMSNPDVKSREAILNVHVKKKPIDPAVDLQVVARGTPGFSGADLENLVNEASLLAVRQDKTVVSMDHFELARDKILMGPERKTLKFTEEDRRTTAIHEVGHALVGKMLPGLDPIHKVTIVPRGNALGVTQTLPIDDKVSLSKDKAEKMISFLLGGRVAEELVLKQITSGASNDIEKATSLARKMVVNWGMSSLGPVSFAHDERDPISGPTKNFIENQIKLIIDSNYTIAKNILIEKMDILHKMTDALLEKETLDSKEIDEICGV